VWGIPPNKPGRLIKGVAVMLEENVDIVAIMTSAFYKEGKSSGQLMKELLYSRLEKLREFTIYPILSQFSPEEIFNILENKLCLIEEPVKNTAEEVTKAARFFREVGVTKIILVTSPDHISRTLRDAIAAWQERYPELAANVYGAPCVTLYSARTPEDAEIAKMENVVIAEPPVMKSFDIRRVFGVLKNTDALREIDAILKKYGK
jgi:hypothetical protein